MKPLKNTEEFLKRFDSFKNSEIRSVDIVSPTTIKLVLTAQDEARGFDWLSIEFEFEGVSDAKLLDSSKLPMIDMQEGITLLNQNQKHYFAVGNYTSLSSLKNSILYLESNSLKYKEGLF